MINATQGVGRRPRSVHAVPLQQSHACACRLDRLNERREDAKQSRAAAMAAADAQVAERQQQTRARRASAATEAAAAAREAAAAAAANTAKSAQVREERSRASCAQARIAQRNAARAAEQREAARKAAARAAEMAVADRKTREDLVRRIRAVERVPMPKGSTFNPTEAGGHGLLEEMSIQVRPRQRPTLLLSIMCACVAMHAWTPSAIDEHAFISFNTSATGVRLLTWCQTAVLGHAACTYSHRSMGYANDAGGCVPEEESRCRS